MGILNLTPDSFSDGGRFAEPGQAIERGLALLAEGADLLDLGAESTRPGGGVYGGGARTVPPAEELDRLLPVLEGLRRETDAPLSVDTRKGEVARQALAAGADLVNDVSALGDLALGRAVAAAGCPLILMHSRGEISTMQERIRFGDLLSEVRMELAQAVDRAIAAGVAADQLLLDPGIGFGKTAAHNFELVRRLGELAELGRPLLVGLSRKSSLGALAGAPLGSAAASVGAAVSAYERGATIVRAHDVREHVEALAAARAVAGA
jgi:dihydropteroate synthase